MVTYVDVPVDVPYTFRIMQTSHSRSFDRSIATITYIDQLPTYEAVENGTLVTKQAVINLETSQGWSYYDPITEAPTDQVTGYGIVTVPNYNANYAYSYPTLNLQFPGGIKDQTVDNKVTAYLTPANKPDSEPIIEITDHVPISLVAAPKPITHEPGSVVTSFNKAVTPQSVLDYNPHKIDASFTWPLTFSVGTEDLALKKVFKNVVFEDFALDDRLVYTKIQLPSSSHTAVVKAYDSNDDEIVEYGGTTTKGVYEFPQYVEGMERIDKITIDLGDREIITTYTVNVVTAFANPTDKSKDYYAGYSSTDHSLNYLPNSARVSATPVLDGSELPTHVSSTVTRKAEIKPFELKVIPDKTQSFRYSESAEDNELQLPHYPGDEGTYTIGIKRSLNNRPFTIDDADLPLENFRMVDLLPLDIVVNREDIVLHPDFASQPGAKFEMISDYGTTGRVAIIFTADEVAANVNTIATVKAKLDLAMVAGFHKNDLYLSFDKDGAGHWGYGKNETTDVLGDNPVNPYMHDYVSLFMAKAQAMNAVKYIRNAQQDDVTGDIVGTGTWTYGVYTPDSGYLQYRLFIKNDTIHDRDKNEIYDVFPYYLDQVTQMNENGERRNRGSAFSNTILAARLYGTTASEFKIEFTTGDVKIPDGVEAGAYLKTLDWVAADADGSAPTGTTGMRIIPQNGKTGLIKKDDSLIVIVDAQSPPYNADTSGKRGYNSFVRTDDSLNNKYIEVPSVWNEVPTPGTLRIEKRSRTFDPVNSNIVAYDQPLSGAEFTLYTLNGLEVAKAISDAEGIAEFKDIRVGDYIVRETGVPLDHYEPAPEDAPQITVKRSDWETKQDYIYNLGKLYNVPFVKGSVELEKINAVDAPMAGIAFDLTNKSTGERFVATTDQSGKATFADIPYGVYTLVETNAPRLLAPITLSEVKISYPGQVVQFIGSEALRNDKADVSLFKLGIRGKLDANKDLSKYVKSDGTIVGETWKFEIQNLTNPQEAVKTVFFSSSYVRNGVKISGLTVNDLYEIKEVSGPPQNQTLYNHNTTSYTFKINTAGELVDADGAKFKAQSIYFPNERKDVDGSVVITKQDAEGNTLEGATFSLAKLNKATSTFELVDGGTKVSDATGKVQWINCRRAAMRSERFQRRPVTSRQRLATVLLSKILLRSAC